jgi:16S rRNA (cytosine967-C5)-methyltransferase
LSAPALPPGLGLRQSAAAKLDDTLGGAPFVPLNGSEIADARDRASANRLVTLALRRHGHLDQIIGALMERGLPRKSGRFEATLRLGLAQLLFMPESGAHSAVHLAVEAVRRDPRSRHLAGLTNAVLRRAQAQAAQFSALPPALLLPDWLRARWTDVYGSDTVSRFAESLLASPPLDLTAKQPETAAAALGAEQLYADTLRIESRDSSVEDLPGYGAGDWWVQDAATALPARLLGLPPGARVLDLCAAPGGKTAQLIKAGYRVTALDSDETRLNRLRGNLARLGYSAEIVCADAGSYRPDRPYDGVLLDAPCTATGTFRRHPEVIWHRRQGDIAERARLQQRLLANAAQCLNPGGVLVYSVCSLEPEEGEHRAKDGTPGLTPLPISAAEAPWPAGALDADGRLRTHPGLAIGEKGGTLDGFFVARFRRG